MAKSLRSKGVRKTKAARRENIHKPVENARLHRLAEAQAALGDAKPFPVSTTMEIEPAAPTTISTKNKFKARKMRQKNNIPNLYGLSRKEMRFK